MGAESSRGCTGRLVAGHPVGRGWTAGEHGGVQPGSTGRTAGEHGADGRDEC